jgi:hypothetical protein
LQRKRRFTDSRIAVDEIEPVARQAATEHIVEAGNAGRAARKEFGCRHGDRCGFSEKRCSKRHAIAR